MAHYPPPIHNIEIGAIAGLTSKGVTSLREIQRTKCEPWQRTIYDSPPEKVYAHHRRVVAKTIRQAHDVVEDWLQEEDDPQSTHLQELEAFLTVAQGYAPPFKEFMDAMGPDESLRQHQLRETFLQITEPLVAGALEGSSDRDIDGEAMTDSDMTALPTYLAELPLFAAAT